MRASAAAAVAILVAASAASPQQPAADSLAEAERLYAEAKYAECNSLLDASIALIESGSSTALAGVRARTWSLKALVVYALRDEGGAYQDQVRVLLLRAVEADPYHDLGDPAGVPPFVARTFRQVREEYLARYARVTRRYSVGLLAALVVDPTDLNRPSLVQPGLLFGYNLNPAWTLVLDMRLPLTLPFYDSIRGQATALWYPNFMIDRVSTAVAASYVFALDNLDTYSHSLSLAGQGEILTRSGLGVGARSELVRVDLIFGQVSTEDLPDYRSLSLFGSSFVRATFANTTVYLFYVFGGRRAS
jgi:hypothetical protein